MDEDKFNMSLRKFLKQVGVTSQHAIEELVREKSLDRGPLRARAVVTIDGQDFEHVVDGEIDLA